MRCDVSFLFKIDNISPSQLLENFVISFTGEKAVSSGEYVRVD